MNKKKVNKKKNIFSIDSTSGTSKHIKAVREELNKLRKRVRKL